MIMIERRRPSEKYVLSHLALLRLQLAVRDWLRSGVGMCLYLRDEVTPAPYVKACINSLASEQSRDRVAF